MREHVLDRFAMLLSVDEPLTLEQRVEGVTVAAQWQDDWRAVAAEAASDEEDLALSVVRLPPPVAVAIPCHAMPCHARELAD